MEVIITGAGGFVGSFLTKKLLKNGHRVSAIGLGKSSDLINLGIKVYEIDILNESAVYECMNKIKPDACIHLAAISNIPVSWDNPKMTMDVNICGTLNVLQALRNVNLQAKFLNIGSSDEYGLMAKKGIPLTEEMLCQPQNPYAISKYCAEQLVLQLGKKYGMQVIHTRSFNHFGPGQASGFVISDFASQIASIEQEKREPVLRVGDLSASRDFTFVTDVVAAYVALLENDVPNGVYNVCSGETRSIESILQYLISLSDTDIIVERDKDKMRVSEVPIFVGNADKLKRITNWKPHYDFGQGLREVLDYWRKQ